MRRPHRPCPYEVGDAVRVLNGAFTSFGGVVDEVDRETATVTVLVAIFGKPTPVELDYAQVEKV